MSDETKCAWCGKRLRPFVFRWPWDRFLLVVEPAWANDNDNRPTMYHRACWWKWCFWDSRAGYWLNRMLNR